ncbi:MAG: hypothetical protein K2X48_15055 [Chitinophagaceae bacterium]|nr:hypothetical protein [Chitinophagaceae bacterium]
MPLWFVITLCCLPFILFLPFTSAFRQKYPDAFGYVLSLVGTFVGIIAGLYFTDLAAANDKRKLTVKVLEASKEELQWLINRAKAIDLVTDTVAQQQRQKYYYLEMPSFFTQTLRSELLSEILQPKTHEQFNVIRENLLFDVDLLRKDVASSDEKHLDEDLKDYKNQLTVAIEVMNSEIELLGKNISLKEFEKKAKQRVDSLMR